MLASNPTGNTSREATIPPGHICLEAMRHLRTRRDEQDRVAHFMGLAAVDHRDAAYGSRCAEPHPGAHGRHGLGNFAVGTSAVGFWMDHHGMVAAAQRSRIRAVGRKKHWHPKHDACISQ